MVSHQSHPPLRLLLVTDGETIPRWLLKCLEAVEQSGAANVVLVLQAAQQEGRGLRHLLFTLYKKIDRYLFRRSPDALAPIPLESALPNRRVVDLRPALAASQPVSPPVARTPQEEGIDVVLDPLSLLPAGRLAELSRYGVWRTIFGQSGDPRTQSTPAFWEVVEGQPSTETRVCMQRNGFDKNLALYVSVAPTDRRSVSRSQNHVYWRISAALARMIQMLWNDPDAFLERFEAAAPFEGAQRPSPAPGNLEMVRASTRLVRRYVSDKVMNTLYREQWALAYQHGVDNRPVMGTLQTLIPPMDRYWADPFPIQLGNHYYLFHEEVPFATGKGSIVVTVVDDQGHTVAPPIPVLEEDYHLSYPFVFQWDGDFFMTPETASRHRVELYRCVDFPSHWKFERVLLAGPTAFDPTPAFLFGKWWLFTNIPAPGAGTADELHLFCADSPLGPWTPHRNNPVKSDIRSGRPAGRIFESQGQFYRPAQDCSKRYGYAVSINRILQLDAETYQEVEVDRIIPNCWGSQVAGVHTLNRAGNLMVIDCLVRRSKLWADHR